MIEPTLNYVACPGAAANALNDQHRMAYWEWNQTGNPAHPHVIVCVHGLTRQGRDFDVVAQALSRHARVVCPDVVGRGCSDWLADPMAYALPQYVADMQALMAQLHAQAPIQTLDWLGTSMGGLIGMCIAGSEAAVPPVVPIRKLLLNDVGPVLEWPALERIASYVGGGGVYAQAAQAIQALRDIAPGFGPHTDAQWQALSWPMLRPVADNQWRLHYDPAIALPFKALTQVQSEQGQAALWALYEGIKAQTLLVRGADSDLLSRQTAQAMADCGPQAVCIELEGVGHAPTLVVDDQVAIVRDFFFG